MAVNYDLDAHTGLATLACSGCGCLEHLGFDIEDDDRMDVFVRRHGACRDGGQTRVLRRSD